MSDETERREFLKIAGAAAIGGLTMTALGASEAEAATPMSAAPTMSAMAPARMAKTLTLRCGPDIDIEHLVAAMKKGLGQAGCGRCGLLGIDVLLHQGDPVERFQGAPLKIDVPGVKQATFG